MKTIVCDVDDVVADLVKVWLCLYNGDYDDNLTEKNIVNWQVDQFVKPECGTKIFSYIANPKIYDIVPTVPLSKWGIASLKDMGFRVVFATTPMRGTEGVKLNWLLEHEFIQDKKDYVEIYDKSLLNGIALIDDKPQNCEEFELTGRPAFAFSREWNANYHGMHFKDWYEIVDYFGRFSFGRGYA